MRYLSFLVVERIFSSMKDIKTIKRNSLTVETLEACLLGYQAFKTILLKMRNSMLKNYQDFWKKSKSEDLLLKESNVSKEELKEKEKKQEGVKNQSSKKEL